MNSVAGPTPSPKLPAVIAAALLALTLAFPAVAADDPDAPKGAAVTVLKAAKFCFPAIVEASGLIIPREETMVRPERQGLKVAEILADPGDAVTADEVAIRNLSLCVERCHLAVSGLVAAPYASALAVITPDEAKLGVACIDFGAGTTTLSVFSDGHFIHTDAIALGGAGITTDIARALGAPLEHAERLKTLHGSAFATLSDEREIITFPSVGESQRRVMNQISKGQLAVLIRPRVEEILDLMRRRLASCAHASEAAQTLVLTGGGSQLTGLAELASNMFGRPVRLGRPRTLNGLPEGGSGPDFSSAVGVLKHWARGDDKLSGRAEQRFLRTGTGYLARVSEWIRDNF